jgi:peptide/nickel transport system substrate-binding protein
VKYRIIAFVVALVVSLAAAQPAGTLTIAQAQDPQSWDPIDTFFLAWGMVGSSIFDGLVHRNLDMEIGPGLAESWEWVGDDDDRLRFRLREGVTFHNGEPFDAESVRFTFERLLGEEGAAGPQQANYTSIERVEIIDAHTVDLVLGTPDPVLITKLAGYGAMIVPPGYVTEVAPETFNRMPVGTGPFKVVEYVPDDRLVLEANLDYFRGPPQVERVVFRFISEPSTRVAELQAGRVDIAQGVPISLASSVDRTPGVSVVPVGSPTVSSLRFNHCLAPTDELLIRQAIAHAVDREGIIEAILEGYGTPIASFQSAMSFGFDPDLGPYAYDPERSRALLADAGVAPGSVIQIDFIGTDAIFREVAQAVASMLEAVDLQTNLVTHETNTYYNDMVPSNRVGHLYYSGWGGWTLDFDNTAYLLYSTGQFWNPCFSNEEVDALLEGQRATYDQAEREVALQRVARLSHELLIDLPLYQHQNLWGVADRVQGFTPPADDRHDLTGVSLTN